MKIARKVFKHSDGEFVEVEREVGWLRKRTEIVQEWQDTTISEVADKVKEFVNSIGPERLVNICEYTTCKDRIGDDGINW